MQKEDGSKPLQKEQKQKVKKAKSFFKNYAYVHIAKVILP